MQRETALALLGIGVLLLLLLIGFAVHITLPRPPGPSGKPPDETKPSTVPATFPSTQTVSPVSPPAIVTPSLPPPAIPAPATPTAVVPPSGQGQVTAATPAPLPPAPLPSAGTAFPAVAEESHREAEEAEPMNEALAWARALVRTHQPKWQIRLTKSSATWLGEEGFAFTIEPENRVTIVARTQTGWLYGLLDLAERLQAREILPPQWRWTPPVTERGLVVEFPAWLFNPPHSSVAFRTFLRDRLKELAWWRFNTWVLRCDGREPKLGTALTLLADLAPLYGVKVLVWADRMSPALQTWQRQGGNVVVVSPGNGTEGIAIVEGWEQLPQILPLSFKAVVKASLFAPTLPSPLLRLSRYRERVIMFVRLDKAYRDVFWFDPAWAHQFVQAIREAKLGGFWLSVRTALPLWTIAAFAQAVKAPDANGEALWGQRWAREGQGSSLWLLAFREGSRVLPELLWLGVSDTPQWGAPLKAFLLASPKGQEWGITLLGVPETLRLRSRPSDPSVLTVADLARRWERRARAVWTALAQLPEPSAPDWKVAQRLTLLNAWLAQHYAHKIDAALAWARFEEGDLTAGQESLRHLAKSVQAWEQVVAVANSVSPPNNRWAQALTKWRRELEEYQRLVTFQSH